MWFRTGRTSAIAPIARSVGGRPDASTKLLDDAPRDRQRHAETSARFVQSRVRPIGVFEHFARRVARADAKDDHGRAVDQPRPRVDHDGERRTLLAQHRHQQGLHDVAESLAVAGDGRCGG